MNKIKKTDVVLFCMRNSVFANAGRLSVTVNVGVRQATVDSRLQQGHPPWFFTLTFRVSSSIIGHRCLVEWDGGAAFCELRIMTRRMLYVAKAVRPRAAIVASSRPRCLDTGDSSRRLISYDRSSYQVRGVRQVRAVNWLMAADRRRNM